MKPDKCQLTETKPDWFECSYCSNCYSATNGMYEARGDHWVYKGHCVGTKLCSMVGKKKSEWYAMVCKNESKTP